jgi:hypothetical protein
VSKENERAGVVVGVATDVVNSGIRLPALKLLTPPPPPPDAVADILLPDTEKTTVALLMRFAGAGTTTPLTSMDAEMLPKAVSIKTKSSATIGSHPLRLNPRFGVIGFALCT